MCAFAALTFGLASCGNHGGQDVDNIVEDGCYVIGEATSVADLKADNATTALMAAGKNEAASNALREGLYEKYVALEGGKEFKIVIREGLEETVYGADLKELNLANEEGGNVEDQPNIKVLKGEAAENVAMKVAENGMYHVIFDQQLKVIIVAPVKWGVRGVNDDWGWKEMQASAFNKETMTFTIHFDEVKTGSFKFAYSNGWKIYLSDVANGEKTISVNTNLGKNMENGGDNIELAKMENADIKLVWTNKGGVIKDNYTWELVGTTIVEKPAEFVVGFSGSDEVFGDQDGAGNSWADPQEKTLAAFDAEASNFDATSMEGTYVYKIEDIKFGAGAFKARFNGAWLGWGGFDIVGDVENFSANDGDDNVKCVAEKTYDCVFTAVWKAGKLEGNLKVEFIAK